MIRAHKVQLNPTDEQVAFLTACCHVNRAAFNWGLAEWNRQYATGEKPSAMTLKKQWNARIDTDHPWARETCRDAYASAFFALGDAWSRFFKGQNNRPVFKKRRKSRMSFGLANDKFGVDGHDAKLPKIGVVNMTEVLRFSGKVLAGTVSLKAGRWYLSITVEVPDVQREMTGRQVGIDVGLKTLAVTSAGQQLENQKPLRTSLAKLRRLNRVVSRRKEGGQNWRKAVLRLQRHHEQITNKRRDAWHKFTTAMSTQFDTVCIEDLNVLGMAKNRRLSRAIADAGWATGFAMLDYKCADVRRVPRFYPSSRTCNACGAINHDLKLWDRVWLCKCKSVVDRDDNAAKNIKDVGLTMPMKSSAQVVATSRVKRSRTACKTSSEATQVEVGTSERAHKSAHSR